MLRNVQIIFPNNPTSLDSFLHLKHASLVLIQFENLPDDATKEQLSQRGIRIVKAISANTFIAHLQPQKEHFSSKEIRSILPFKFFWKIAPRLLGEATSKDLQELFVSFLPGTSQDYVRQFAKDIGGTYKNSILASMGYFRMDIPGNRISELAENPEVLAIAEAAKNIPLNYESQRALQVNIAHNPINRGGFGLLGDGITLGVGDNTSGLWHIDTRERIVNYNPAPYSNHGQHTNGTVGGAGTVDPRGEGFAPHAALVDEIYDLIWQRTGPLYSAYNMTATNNSYANVVGDCNAAGVYDVYAAALDSVALAFPNVLHVFASGNDGTMTCSPYPTSFKTVTGGYQTAKNVLVVGNINKLGLINVQSSRGPIVDGRLKPEIVAIGSSVYSTKGNDTYLSASGTSMACPQITGTTGLLQQRFKQKHGGAYPSSALLKALLMNGATDMGNPGPDFTFGFGVADAIRSVAMIDSNWIYSGTISNGGNQNPLTIQVPPNTGQLKVMLYWHDLPASPSSAKQLINDLDLKVMDPNAVTHLPLVLDAAPTAVSAPAVEGSDHLNNVEQVVVNYPQSGSYSVNVSGFSVPSGPQNYMLVYDLVPKVISITSPNDGEAYGSSGTINCYWSAPPGAASFTAEFSADNGASWLTISNTIPADARTTYWNIPGVINSTQCRFRVTRNGTGETSTSGAFVMADQPKLQLSALQCPGYTSLHWSPTLQASSYDVLQKIGFFLQKIASTSDTNFVVSGLSQDSLYYFSVQPIVAGFPSFRSVAVKRQPNTGSCAGSISDGDLALTAIMTPHTGRLQTSSALGSNETLSLRAQNLDDQAAGIYQIAYQINGGAWTTQTFFGIASLASTTVNFSGLNLVAPGDYFIRAAVTNRWKSDLVKANDTISTTVRQLKNDPVNLASGFLEDFESMPRLTLMGDSMGFSPNQHWDYEQSDDTGRLRSFIDNEIN
ncbi:MAG: S8 family serine peptidase, partial [Chitinophagaceae bacterium]